MADRKIIENTIDLSQSFLSKEEWQDVYNILVKDREAFSHRNEMSSYPDIEVDLQVIDNSSFSLNHIMLKRNTNL